MTAPENPARMPDEVIRVSREELKLALVRDYWTHGGPDEVDEAKADEIIASLIAATPQFLYSERPDVRERLNKFVAEAPQEFRYIRVGDETLFNLIAQAITQEQAETEKADND